MNKDQIDSLTRSALKLVAGFLLAMGTATAHNAADFLNMPDVAGVIVALVGMYASHATHQPSTPKTNALPTPTTIASPPVVK